MGLHGHPSAQTDPAQPSGHTAAVPLLKASCLLGTQPPCLRTHTWLSGIDPIEILLWFTPASILCTLIQLQGQGARVDSFFAVWVCDVFSSHTHTRASRAWLLMCPSVRCRNCYVYFAKQGTKLACQSLQKVTPCKICISLISTKMTPILFHAAAAEMWRWQSSCCDFL